MEKKSEILKLSSEIIFYIRKLFFSKKTLNLNYYQI